MQESTSSIYRAMSRFLSGTMISRLSGLARDIVMAYTFGTSPSVAAFLVSIRFAHLLRRVLGEGCLQSAFIPLFEELKKEDPQKAEAFFKSLQKKLLKVLIFIVLIVMTVLGLLLLFPLSEGNRHIITYTLVLMPSLIFICLYGLSASLLQCEGYFFLPSIAPVAFNGLWLIGAFALSGVPPEMAMTFLSIFLIGGSCLQWALLLPKQKKLLPQIHYQEVNIKAIVKPLFLGMIGIGATQLNSALDALFARYASLEGPAYLWYAIRIEQLPLALFGIALSGALLPPLTRAVKAHNMEKATQFLNSAIKTTLVVMIPMTFALIISGKVSVSLLYQRGDFTETSLQETVYCLWGYGLGLLPSVIILVTAPLFFAFSDYKTPSKISCQSVLLNIALNTIGTVVFNLGPYWVAVATSISAFFNAWMLNQALPKLINRKLLEYRGTLIKSLLSSCLYGVCAIAFESCCSFPQRNFTTQIMLFLVHACAFVLSVGPFWYAEFKPKTLVNVSLG